MTPVALLVATLIGLVGVGLGIGLCLIAVFSGWKDIPHD